MKSACRLFVVAALAALEVAALALLPTQAAGARASLQAPGYDLLEISARGQGLEKLLLANQGVRGWTLLDISPDRTRIVFTKGPSTYVARLNGTQVRKIADLSATEAAWAPDGKKIALEAWATSGEPNCGGKDLWVVAVDGSSRSRLETCTTSASWAPDSQHLAFMGDLPPDGLAGKLVVEGENGAGRRVLVGPIHAPAEVAWAPRGGWIAYTYTNGRAVRLHVVNSTGAADVSLGFGEMPTWTADGRHLVFTRAMPHGTFPLFYASRDGRLKRRLARYTGTSPASPSPSGREVAYVGWDPRCSCQAIYVVSVTGGGRHITTREQADAKLDGIFWTRGAKHPALHASYSVGGLRPNPQHGSGRSSGKGSGPTA
ncbi:MAG TPA: hypothetical protein VF002_05465 [Gaiellaceae bacterium]